VKGHNGKEKSMFIINSYANTGSTIAYNSSIELAKKLYIVGFLNGVNKLYSISGFAKLNKALISNINLFFPNEEQRTEKVAYQALKNYKDVFYSLLLVDTIEKFITFLKDRQITQLTDIRLKLPRSHLIKTIKHILSAIGNLFETAKYFGISKAFCKPPQRLCAIAIALIEISQIVGESFNLSRKITPRSLNEILNTENILKLSMSIGKLTLIYLGEEDQSYSTKVLDAFTQNVSFLSYLIKEDK
jgi:hypothetical protein